MNVTVENLAPCKKLVRFEVDAAKVDETFATVTKDFVRQAAMPGFRPGKAPKERVMRGIPGVATKEQVINVTENAGALEKIADTTPQVANVLSSALSLLSGAGTIKKTAGEYQLTIDRAAYSAGVLAGVR